MRSNEQTPNVLFKKQTSLHNISPNRLVFLNCAIIGGYFRNHLLSEHGIGYQNPLYSDMIFQFLTIFILTWQSKDTTKGYYPNTRCQFFPMLGRIGARALTTMEILLKYLKFSHECRPPSMCTPTHLLRRERTHACHIHTKSIENRIGAPYILVTIPKHFWLQNVSFQSFV